jgi:uncharacterized protein Usg
MAHSTSEFERMLHDYRLTTAEIIYHLPDHPALLQRFIWQELDLAPKFPRMKKLINFWEAELDGKIHSVSIMQTELIAPHHFRLVNHPIRIH